MRASTLTTAFADMLGPNAQQLLEPIAGSLGFSCLGITGCQVTRRDRKWLLRLQSPPAQSGTNNVGTMDWLAKTAWLRARPQAMWPTARNIICLGVCYAPQRNFTSYQQQLADKSLAIIANYAQYSDYHKLILKQLRKLANQVKQYYPGNYRAFVDTAPIAEKPLASQAQLGWIGKHSNLVSRNYGSWLLLCCLVTDAELKLAGAVSQQRDNDNVGTRPPTNGHCGSCVRCQQACPTDALDVPYRLKITSCLAYLSIEHQGAIPEQWRSAMGNRIFGCDDCLAACPWNKFAQASTIMRQSRRNQLGTFTIREALSINASEFAARFTGTPIKRLTVARLLRNALIVAGNSNDVTLLPFIAPHRNSTNSVISEAANWAQHQLTAS